MLRLLTVFLPLLLIAGPLYGQSSTTQGVAPSANAKMPASSSAPAYTLRTSTRVVLTDVTVTDGQGNPVHGLDRSRFHIFDNNHPQELSSFEEHMSEPPRPSVRLASAAPNTFSNDYLLHAPAASNTLFLDTTTLGIVDQSSQICNRRVAISPVGMVALRC
jgi:hypothetical protein